MPDGGRPRRRAVPGTAGPAGCPPRRRLALLHQLGPGLVSGAADDDPSGIVTYSQAGAQLGIAACWAVLLCYPLMVATQEISARIGRATGAGLVAALRHRYPPWAVGLVVAAVVFANTVNLGADLGAMADVLHLLAGGPRLAWVALCGAACAGLLLRLRLGLYVRVVTWAALSLSVYVVAAVSAAPSWGELLRQLPASPAARLDASAIGILVALLGTTISPYLFIWQSALEGERARGLLPLRGRGAAGLAGEEAARIRADTCAGMAVAALVATAVAATAAFTLHAAGVTSIATAAQAAGELRRVAGPLAQLLYALGILLTGALAVPALAGSAAFAVGEGLDLPVGLARHPADARAFYGCILAATAAGAALNLLGLDPVRTLIWSAVVNGVLSVPVLVAMMLIAGEREIMGQLAPSQPVAALGWLTAAAMAVAALGLAAL